MAGEFVDFMNENIFFSYFPIKTCNKINYDVIYGI